MLNDEEKLRAEFEKLTNNNAGTWEISEEDEN
jgi:hypothetical protein